MRYPDLAVPSLGRPALFAALVILARPSAGCDEHAHASSPDAAPPPPASAPSVRPSPSASSSGSPEKGELSLLKSVFTSEVKNREPTDVLTSAKPGQRVWAHLTVRNRGGAARTITLVFKISGKERSRVDLKVDPSWSFRTWGYATLRAGDSGELGLEVLDDSGATLAARALPIRADDVPRPEKPVPLDE